MGMAVTAGSAWAGDAEAGKGLTADQQRQRSALIQKYDVNKDGVLDKKEVKQMSKVDKKALAKVGGIGTAKKSAKTEQAEGTEKAAKEKDEKLGKEEEKAGEVAVKPAKGKHKK